MMGMGLDMMTPDNPAMRPLIMVTSQSSQRNPSRVSIPARCAAYAEALLDVVDAALLGVSGDDEVIELHVQDHASALRAFGTPSYRADRAARGSNRGHKGWRGWRCGAIVEFEGHRDVTVRSAGAFRRVSDGAGHTKQKGVWPLLPHKAGNPPARSAR